MTSNTEKATSLILMSLLVLTIGVSLSTLTSVLPQSSASLVPQPYIPEGDPYPHLRAPPAPDELGCYSYTLQTGWIPEACVPDEVLRTLPPLTQGGSYGVFGVSTSTGNKNHGETFINFNTYSGETDSKTGNNAWSIQLNTNNYVSGSTTYWAQFTVQNRIGANNNVCVYRVDVTHQLYNAKCVNGVLQTLTSTWAGYVTGDITGTGNLKTTFCAYPGPSCWSVTASDLYGLNGDWKKSSGTILGWGASSTAQFTRPTNHLTVVYISPATSASGYTDYLTGEKNNLVPGTRSTSCNAGTCTTSWWSAN